jgi:hypothetical protein
MTVWIYDTLSICGRCLGGIETELVRHEEIHIHLLFLIVRQLSNKLNWFFFIYLVKATSQ